MASENILLNVWPMLVSSVHAKKVTGTCLQYYLSSSHLIFLAAVFIPVEWKYWFIAS